MNNSDKSNFKKIMDSVCDYYNRDKISTDVIRMYFTALENYSIDDASRAISEHMRDTKHGSFFPKISDICRHIDGPELTTDDVIAAARNAITPLGIMSRTHIGCYDLESRDAYYLRHRATEVLQRIDELKRKSLAGDYTKHELAMMHKYKVNPLDALYPGFLKPSHNIKLEHVAVHINYKDNREIGKCYEGPCGDSVIESMRDLVKKMCKKC